MPELNLAIECNGTYYHSINHLIKLGKNPENYHYNKSIECKNKNIVLIHIWEHKFYKDPIFYKNLISNRINGIFPIFSNNEIIDFDLYPDLNGRYIKPKINYHNNIQYYTQGELCFQAQNS